MAGEARSLHDIYSSIEEVMATYGERTLKLLIRGGHENLHELRGRAQATEDLLIQLRNALGYDHTQL